MTDQVRVHTGAEADEAGFVIEAKGYLLQIEGLPSARIHDVLVDEHGKRALVMALREECIEAYALDPGTGGVGDRFGYSPEGIRFPTGPALFGRALHVLGEAADGKGEFTEKTDPLRMEGEAPDMSARVTMDAPLFSGMTAVDVLIPLAKGQRQLIVGPISSGKNIFLERIVQNQKETGVVCLYVLIGRPVAYVTDVVARLFSAEGNPNTVVLVSFSDDPAPVIYLAPIVALQLAETYARAGNDVLLVLDDLGSHAKYHREIALQSGEVPGRESYPGDLFYQQARLLERGGRFGKALGGGSITLLPVLETNIEDISSLISTNLVSATDGHLFFSPLIHAEGYFPAVSAQESVTRVGRKTQTKLAKQLSIRTLALLAEYEHQRRYSQFGTQLSEETRATLSRGEILRVFLDQDPANVIPVATQVLLLSLVFTSFFDGKDASFARAQRVKLIKGMAHDATTDAEVIGVIESAQRGSISFEQFQKKLTGVLPYFTSLCKP